MDVDGLFDLVLGDFKGLISFVFRLKVAGLEIVEKSTDFGSLLTNLIFEILTFDFLSGLFVFSEELLG